MDSREKVRTLIDADRTWQSVDFGELWRYRNLLWMLVVRELTVRYRQAAVGVAWAVIQPVTTMVIFSFSFGAWAERRCPAIFLMPSSPSPASCPGGFSPRH